MSFQRWPSANTALLGVVVTVIGAQLADEHLWWARALLLTWTWIFFFRTGEADGHFNGYMDATREKERR